MKHIVITAFHAFISRNIFNTDVLKLLRADSSLKITIITHPHKVEYLTKWYGAPNVVVIGVDLSGYIAQDKRLNRAAFFLQNSNYVRDQRLDYLLRNPGIVGRMKHHAYDLSAKILSRIPFARSVFRLIDRILSPQLSINGWVRRARPSLLFVTDIFAPHDTMIARAFNNAGVRVIGMARSWDNTTTKGILRFVPPVMIANSATIADELTTMHDVPRETIHVVGLPQFDDWQSAPKMTREDFCKKHGLDPRKKIILFAPAGAALSDTDWQVCTLLKRAFDDGRLPDDIQIFISNHPGHPADLSRAEMDNHFVVMNLGQKFKEGDKDTEFSPNDQNDLMNSIYHSDVVTYIASSMGLDARVFNKPQIMVSFDGWEKKPYAYSVSRYHQEDCLYNLIKTGGVRLAHNIDEFCQQIRDYLKNPNLDAEGRDRIITAHMHALDSQAGERIAKVVLDELNKVS